jgi:fructokinase
LEYDVVKLIDVNLRKPYDSPKIIKSLIEKADIVKLNDDELLEIAEWYGIADQDEQSIIKWITSHYNVQMVCVTKGEKGALLYTDNNFYEHSGFKVKAIDTVGAGDAFLAGLVASLIKGKNPSESLAFACATGAFVASKEGATPKYDMSEIENILNI